MLGAVADRLLSAGCGVVRLEPVAGEDQAFAALRSLLAPDQVRAISAASVAAAAATLVAASGDGGTVVVVDGLDELDAGSAAVLHHVVASEQGTILGSMTVGGHRSMAQMAWWPGIVPCVELAPLGRADADRLAELRVGGSIDAASRERLWGLARGHPSWIVAAVETTRAAGAWERSGGLWCLVGDLEAAVDPDVLVQLDRVSRETRAVLQCLSLVDGLPIDDAEALGGPGPLTDAERRSLVRVDEDDGGALWCAVASRLVADALRATLDPAATEARWGRVAEVLAESKPSGPEGVLAWGLALVGAGRIGDGADPAEVAVVARAAQAAQILSRWEVCSELAALAWRQGRVASSLSTLTQALGMLGDHASIRALSADLEGGPGDAESMLHHAATIAISQFHSGDDEGAFATSEQARAEAPADLVPYVDVFESRLRSFAGDQASALALAGPWADHPSLPVAVEALTVTGAVRATQGDGDGAIVNLDRAFALALSGPEAPVALAGTPYLMRLSVLADVGRLDEAVAGAEAVEREVARDGDRTAHGWLALHLGRTHLRAGRPRTAARWFGEAVNDLRQMHRPGWLAHPSAGLVAAHAASGDLEAAREAEAAWAQIPAHVVRMFRPEELRFVAWLDAARGDDDRVVTRLLDAASLASSIGSLPYEAEAWHDLVRLGGADNRDRCASELARLVADTDGAFVAAHAAQARALATGDLDALAATARRYEALGAGLDAAESWAEVVRRSDDGRERARARRRVAEMLPEGEGVTSPLLRELEGRPSLTGREAEVASLVAGGASRQDVADRLVVSVRTVDSHLQRIYRKLGVRGRAGLVIALGEHGG